MEFLYNEIMIIRYYENLETYLVANKVLVLYGARRVGKTTLVNQFLSRTQMRYRSETGDDMQVREIIGSQNISRLRQFAAGYDLIVIDEAQRIPEIGLGLKILVDHVPGIKIIVTGSASLDLASKISEPLTGRKRVLSLYPIAQLELKQIGNEYDLMQRLPDLMVFGSYPEVCSADNPDQRIELLREISQSYLLKDILEIERVKGAKIMMDLLRLIAYQVGSEVSLNELGSQLAIDRKTIARYLDLLEKAFILVNLRGFSRNLRKEITRTSKYYFVDLGIRNAVINNFNPLPTRNDIGRLWENFLVMERIKKQEYHPIYANNYFWRTWDQKEVDWIEEREGKLFAFEFKYSTEKSAGGKAFLETYPEAEFSTVSRENYLNFVS